MKINKPKRATFKGITDFFRDDYSKTLMSKIPQELLSTRVNIFQKQLPEGISTPLRVSVGPSGLESAIVITPLNKKITLNGLENFFDPITTELRKVIEFAEANQLAVMFATNKKHLVISPQRIANYAAITFTQDQLKVDPPTMLGYSKNPLSDEAHEQITQILYSKDWLEGFTISNGLPKGSNDDINITLEVSPKYAKEYIKKQTDFLTNQLAIIKTTPITISDTTDRKITTQRNL